MKRCVERSENSLLLHHNQFSILLSNLPHSAPLWNGQEFPVDDLIAPVPPPPPPPPSRLQTASCNSHKWALVVKRTG